MKNHKLENDRPGRRQVLWWYPKLSITRKEVKSYGSVSKNYGNDNIHLKFKIQYKYKLTKYKRNTKKEKKIFEDIPLKCKSDTSIWNFLYIYEQWNIINFQETEFGKIDKLFCISGIQRTISKMYKKKEPGTYGLLIKIRTKFICKQNLFKRILNKCLEKGIFPVSWKTTHLVLFNKEGKDYSLPEVIDQSMF